MRPGQDIGSSGARHRQARLPGPLSNVRPGHGPLLPIAARKSVDRASGAAAGVYLRNRTILHRGCHRSEEHTSELQSLMRISYAVFFLKKKKTKHTTKITTLN